MTIAKDVDWYLERLPTPPSRMHQRGVWSDLDDGLGSELGSPAFTRTFERWLENAFAETIERYEGRACDHPTLSERELEENRRAERAGGMWPHQCETCSGSGRRSGERSEYSWPMRAAMERAKGWQPVHPNAPRPSSILIQLAMAEGDVGRVADVLMVTYPCMASPAHAMAHLGNALGRLKRTFSETNVPRMPRGDRFRDLSESQSQAEAAA